MKNVIFLYPPWYNELISLGLAAPLGSKSKKKKNTIIKLRATKPLPRRRAREVLASGTGDIHIRHPVGNLFLSLLDAFFLCDVCLQVSPPQLVAIYFDSFLLSLSKLPLSFIKASLQLGGELLEGKAFNLLTATLYAINIYQMNNNKNKACWTLIICLMVFLNAFPIISHETLFRNSTLLPNLPTYKYQNYLHFTDKETKIQRALWNKPHRW